MTHEFHKLWMKIGAVVIMSTAPVLFLATMTATTEPARLLFDLIHWPLDGVQQVNTPEIRLLSALSGGFLIGWGVTIWLMAQNVYDHAPQAVRRAMLTGAVAWFVWDSVGSVTAGVPSNVIFNIGFLLIAVGPLWWPVKVNGQASQTPQ